MRELSLNVLDVVQNSITAGADLIEISLIARPELDLLQIFLRDNGCGMTDEQAALVEDPFYTTRSTRKIGLGIPLFKMAAEMSGGSFYLWTEALEGTAMRAEFMLSHMDRMPAGDFASTVCGLIRMNPDLDFVYTQVTQTDNETVFFRLDTRELRQMLEDVPLDDPSISDWLQEYTASNTALVSALCPGL